VKLIPAQSVKPFVKSNNNDFLDAEAIAEAIDRQNMSFVPIKTEDQLDLEAIHRVRDGLVARRTSVINQKLAPTDCGYSDAEKSRFSESALPRPSGRVEVGQNPISRDLAFTRPRAPVPRRACD